MADFLPPYSEQLLQPGFRPEVHERWYDGRRDPAFDAITVQREWTNHAEVLAIDAFFRQWWRRAPLGTVVHLGNLRMPPEPGAEELLCDLVTERSARPLQPSVPAHDLLRSAIIEDVPAVRARSLELLGHVDAAAARSLAKKLIHHGSPVERCAAARVLDDPELLAEALETGASVYDHMETAAALARHRDRAALERGVRAITRMDLEVWRVFVIHGSGSPVDPLFRAIVVAAADAAPELRAAIEQASALHDWASPPR